MTEFKEATKVYVTTVLWLKNLGLACLDRKYIYKQHLTTTLESLWEIPIQMIHKKIISL